MRNINNLCSVIAGQRANAAAFIDGSEKYRSIHGQVLFMSFAVR